MERRSGKARRTGLMEALEELQALDALEERAERAERSEREALMAPGTYRRRSLPTADEQ